MNIRQIPFSAKQGKYNMAMDEALLLSGTPSLRFYTWSRPCVSLGHYQKSAELNLDYIRGSNIDLVRRPSGGKGVYHDRELTYSIVLPLADFKGDIHRSYRLIGNALLEGLRLAGLDVHQRQQADRRRAAANCFQAAGFFEIYIGEKKLVGNAQLRRAGFLLQQGSILMDLDPEKWSGCFPPSSPGQPHPFTAVNRERKTPLSPGRLADYLIAGFKSTFPWDWYTATPARTEKQLAGRLISGKYGRDSWNLKR